MSQQTISGRHVAPLRRGWRPWRRTPVLAASPLETAQRLQACVIELDRARRVIELERACRVIELDRARIGHYQPSHPVTRLLGPARVIDPLNLYFGQTGRVVEFTPNPLRAVGLTFPEDDDPTFIVYFPAAAIERVRPETADTVVIPTCADSDPFADLDDVEYFGRRSQ